MNEDQLYAMQTRAHRMLCQASPLQHYPWVANLVRDVVDMCAEVAATEATGRQATECANCGADERYPTAAHILDCLEPVSHKPHEQEPKENP